MDLKTEDKNASIENGDTNGVGAGEFPDADSVFLSSEYRRHQQIKDSTNEPDTHQHDLSREEESAAVLFGESASDSHSENKCGGFASSFLSSLLSRLGVNTRGCGSATDHRVSPHIGIVDLNNGGHGSLKREEEEIRPVNAVVVGISGSF